MSEIDELLAAAPRAGGTTPIYALPYPGADDPVAAGAANIQALAEAVEALAASRAKLLADITVDVAGAVIDIDFIPQLHTHLRLVCNLKQTGGTTIVYTYLSFNGDANTANYTGWANPVGGFRVPDLAYSSDLAWSPRVFDLPYYTKPDAWKTILHAPASVGVGYWSNVAPVTRLTLTMTAPGTFRVGTRVQLYGQEAL